MLRKKIYPYAMLRICVLMVLFLCASASSAWCLHFYVGAEYKINPIGNDAVTAWQHVSFETGFDCTTYVETFLAQYAQRYKGLSFQEHLHKIRYMNGQVGFFTRAHFMEYHWIPNALQHNYLYSYPLEDTKNSHFKIYLQEWFTKNAFVKHKDVLYMEQVRQQPALATASIAYVPVEQLNAVFLEKLPNTMVVFFLKEVEAHSWPGQKEKQVLITHMGILREKHVYHASIRTKKVSKMDFLAYVRSIPSYVGVSFYAVQEPLQP